MVHRDWTLEVCNNWDSVDYELKRIVTTVRVQHKEAGLHPDGKAFQFNMPSQN